MDFKACHIRQEKLTGRWVIFPKKPSERESFEKGTGYREKAEDKDTGGKCPFCSGNESMLGPVIEEGQIEQRDCWSLRVASLKESSLQEREPSITQKFGPYFVSGGFGKHEIIIETPLHDCDIPSMSQRHLEKMVDMYANRVWAMYDEYSHIQSVTLFRNYSEGEMSSEHHPHCEVVGSSVVPRSVFERERNAHEYYRNNHRCLVCDMIRFEHAFVRGKIYENGSFLVMVPFASEVPYEFWLIPRFHSSDFSLIDGLQAKDFAKALSVSIGALKTVLKGKDYNFIIHTASRGMRRSGFVHWYVTVQPTVVKSSDYQGSQGFSVNRSMPEEDAEILRNVVKKKCMEYANA